MSKRPIHKAAEKGDLKSLQEELNKGEDVNAVDEDGWTPLLIAAFDRQLEAVKLLVANKATVDLADTNGSTALHCACINGHTEIAKFLLDKDANINKADNEGWTPLHFGYDGKEEVAKLLIERKADTTAKVTDGTRKGKTVVDLANERNHENVVILLQIKPAPPAPPAPMPTFMQSTAAAATAASDKGDSKSSTSN